MALSSLGASAPNTLAADARSLNELKTMAGQDSPSAIKEAAKQFESLFMRELLKSMREATMKSGMLDNEGSKLGTDLLDQQLSVSMSGLPGGLSDLIARQLSKQTGTANANNPALPSFNPTVRTAPTSTGNTPATISQSDFVQKHTGVARRVEQETGLPAGYMIGQAGHETGWGRKEIRNADGSTSFNLFGIKAGGNWTGKVAEVTTTEYVNGVARKTVAKFRAYSSYEESFRDFAKLINDNPRYAQARQQTSSVQAYAGGLQKAGYATDPDYASKLSRAINTTLRLQRAQA